MLPVLLSGLATGGAARTSPAAPPTPAPDPVLASLSRSATPPAHVELDRVAGDDRYGTAVAVSQRLVPDGQVPPGGVPVVFLASGIGFADAAAAGPAAAHEHGVVLLTPQDALPDVVAAELTRLAPQRVVVVGGPSSVSDAVLTAAAAASGVTPDRVWGADRYATAADLSADAFPSGPVDTVFLAAGTNFPDALSVGPVAGIDGGPVLLSRPDRLPDATATELRRLAPAHVVIVGGTASIGVAVANAVATLGPTVERVSGGDRYATAAAVATRFLPTATTAVIAAGTNFPDALSGGPLAATPRRPDPARGPRRDPHPGRHPQRRHRRPARRAGGPGRPGVGPRRHPERAGRLVGRAARRCPPRDRTIPPGRRCTTTTSAWRWTSRPPRPPTPTW